MDDIVVTQHVNLRRGQTVDDIIKRLRGSIPGDPDYKLKLISDAAAEIERLRAMLDAVANLHEPTSVNDPRCSSCGNWPCRTHLAVCDECRGVHRG